MASYGVAHAVAYRRHFDRQKCKLLELNEKINDIIIFDKDIPPNASFTFVDFASNCKYKDEETMITTELCKKYSEVVEYANDWLSENLNWRVVGCETVNATMRVTTDLEYHHYDKEYANYLNPLTLFRLWLTKREDFEIEKKDETIIQRIKYLDFIPQKINNSNDQFEDLDSVTKRINERIKSGGIDGKILNIQTYMCDADKDWNVDPEETIYKFPGKFVFIIRVFYEIGPPCDDIEICIMDFVPECQKTGHLFSAPKFESQSDTFKRCSLWLSENPEIIFCNAQTIELKIKSKTNIDTKCMSFSKYNGGFIRIIRVIYQKPPEIPDNIPQTAFQPPPPPLYLASKLMVLDRSDHKHDDKILMVSNISISKSIIADFFSRTEWNTNEKLKWKFLNIETLNIFAENEPELESRIDNSYRHCRPHESRTYDIYKMAFYTAIIYFDVGYYGKNEIDVLRAFQLKRRGSSRF